MHALMCKHVCSCLSISAAVPRDGVGVCLCAVPHGFLVFSKQGGHAQEGPTVVQRWRRMGLGTPASALSLTYEAMAWSLELRVSVHWVR